MIKDLENKEYIILELIPTSPNPETGEIAQLSALKLNGLTLLDRFDYRLKEDNINNIYIEEMVNYDKENFIYKDTTKEIKDEFKKWIKKDLLLIIDNDYTKDYLKEYKNKKESIFKYLNTCFYDDVFKEIIDKYNLEPSNYIVDLLYEALIYESNNENK
ncbi:MAG: hypothetical protein IJN90_01845 [Bacilli bacterium]|nr:hypothetical protein [Bacilli bacterium]